MESIHNRSAKRSRYSNDATVYLKTGTDKIAVLQHAMEVSGFMDHVGSELARSGKSLAEFQIAIKPNFMTAALREESSPVYTDPQLVEYVVARLRDIGFQNIAVVESRNVYDYSFEGRSVKAVAGMVGYTSNGYRIEDLSEQKEPFNYGGVLGEHSVGRTWRDADYRISFAKNKTHWQCYFTGCMKNVYGCLPEWDKMKHYHGNNREFYECCILILDAFPVHFGFVDAWVSGDGLSGHVRDAHPNHTKTIFASENVFAIDWVMGEKMGLDPLKSFVIQEAIRHWGRGTVTPHGDMTPWKPWNNVAPIVVTIMDGVEEMYEVSRFFSRAFACEQDKRFHPVREWQWLYGPIQTVIRSLTRLFD